MYIPFVPLLIHNGINNYLFQIRKRVGTNVTISFSSFGSHLSLQIDMDRPFPTLQRQLLRTVAWVSKKLLQMNERLLPLWASRKDELGVISYFKYSGSQSRGVVYQIPGLFTQKSKIKIPHPFETYAFPLFRNALQTMQILSFNSSSVPFLITPLEWIYDNLHLLN